MNHEQIEAFIARMAQYGKPDQCEVDRIHFLLRRGAAADVVEELFVTRTLFMVHWATLITNFTGLEGPHHAQSTQP